MIQDRLELGGSLGVFSRRQVSLCTMIEDRPIWVLRDWHEQIHGLTSIASVALDDRTYKRQIEPLLQRVLGKQPIQFSCQRFHFIITLISNTEPDRILALSFWQTEADAERYNRDQFPTVSEILKPLYERAPKVTTYNVDTSTTHKIAKGKAA